MKTMMRLLLTLSMMAAALPAFSADSPAPSAFDTYYMVFLYRGDNPPQLDEQAAAELQNNHLRHLTKLWNDGHALVAGPFGGDGALRGLVLFRGSLGAERVRELAEADPAVQAGRLRVEVRPWYTEAGVLAFPKQPPKE